MNALLSHLTYPVNNQIVKSLLKTKKTSAYGKTPKWIDKRQDLDSYEKPTLKLLYGSIGYNSDGGINLSVGALAKDLSVSTRTFQRRSRSLEAKGLLKIVPNKTKHGDCAENTYYLINPFTGEVCTDHASVVAQWGVVTGSHDSITSNTNTKEYSHHSEKIDENFEQTNPQEHESKIIPLEKPTSTQRYQKIISENPHATMLGISFLVKYIREYMPEVKNPLAYLASHDTYREIEARYEHSLKKIDAIRKNVVEIFIREWRLDDFEGRLKQLNRLEQAFIGDLGNCIRMSRQHSDATRAEINLFRNSTPESPTLPIDSIGDGRITEQKELVNSEIPGKDSKKSLTQELPMDSRENAENIFQIWGYENTNQELKDILECDKNHINAYLAQISGMLAEKIASNE